MADLFAKCPDCDRIWLVAKCPIELPEAARLAKAARCQCGTSRRPVLPRADEVPA